jgi:tetratricopeptide (TPR) repeat protein
MCASQYETAFSFMNLGIACLRLKDYDSAEKVLTKANIQDISNSNVWGYMTLVMLMKGNRVNNAFQSLKESIRLQINNDDLMLDIGNAFYDIGEP